MVLIVLLAFVTIPAVKTQEKQIKKTVLLLLTSIFSIATLAACVAGESGPTGTAAEIADKVFMEAGVGRFGMSRTLEKDEDIEFLLGTKDYPKIADSIVVIPMISFDTRALYVIKATNKGDAEIIKTNLEDNIDVHRQFCVTFSPEDVVIESRGTVIFMTINSDPSQRTALTESFKTIE